MSDESPLTTTAESIQETISGTIDATDVASLVDDETSARSVGADLGSRIGRELGGILGREIGGIVAVDVRDRKRPRVILSDAAHRLLEVLAAVLRTVDVESVVSRLMREGGSLLSGDSPAMPSFDAALSGDQDDETESESDEGGEASVEDSAISELSADDLQEVKEGTYRELLEVMSYGDLQSVAKEVGVKANLGQDEMIDQIVAQVSEDDGE